MFTNNEQRVLRLLAVSSQNYLSINAIAKELSIVPNAAYKVLQKFEHEGIIQPKIIANSKSYTFNFSNEKTKRMLELVLIPQKSEGKIKVRLDDLRPLRNVTEICILFGSYITKKKKPNDLDVLFGMEKKHFEKYKEILTKVQDLTPVKIHDVVQTNEDLIRNLKEGDAIVTTAIREGIVLWGYELIVETIKNVQG